MIFTETSLAGAFVIDIERREDDRGFFARSFCERELEARGLVSRVVQQNISQNHRAGTVRGLHFQRAPHEETKIVRCTRGAIFDVIVDLRPASPTCGKHVAFELTASNHRALYVPEGFAHGFQTLCDDAEVLYLMGAFFEPSASAGLRFDDPALAIAWPLPVSVISDRDRALPGFSP